MNQSEQCWCGRPLHYRDINLRRQVEEAVKRFGEFMDVTVDGPKTFQVQRHYIALHGIRDKDLLALGFKEVLP